MDSRSLVLINIISESEAGDKSLSFVPIDSDLL